MITQAQLELLLMRCHQKSNRCVSKLVRRSRLHLGQLIRQHRERRGLSRTQLAQRAHMADCPCIVSYAEMATHAVAEHRYRAMLVALDLLPDISPLAREDMPSVLLSTTSPAEPQLSASSPVCCSGGRNPNARADTAD